MTKITENAIEEFAIELLQKLGYQYIYGPNIAPDTERPERDSFEEVVLAQRLESAVQRINPDLPYPAIQEAIKEVQRINAPELITNNETFHRYLTEGVKVSYQKKGKERGDLVKLVDFEAPDNNGFLVVNQFRVTDDNRTKRPDVVLFVNGLPLAVLELKNASSDTASIRSAFKQLQTYKDAIPSLFTYNGILVISDGLEAKAGALSAGFARFMAWKTADGEVEASPLVGQLETLIKGMLNKETLLDLIRYFTVFEKSKKEDPETGITTVETVKKVAAYHQYYAVNRAVESTLRASGFVSRENIISPDNIRVEVEPQKYGVAGVDQQPMGDRKGGVMWHTQGSGKSLSMVFFTGKIVLAMDNPTIVVITDRNDLDDQLFDTFASSTQLLRQEPKQAESRKHLKELLKVASGGIVFTTIHKFQPDEGNIYEELSDRTNIVVIADEAHRTQYGFKAKIIDDKDKKGNIVGKKTVYGFAKYLRDALPNATYLGFTGTPIEKTDINTPAVFGNYIDVYDIAQAVEDGATVRIFYESRLAKIRLSDEGRKMVEEVDEELDQDDLTESQKAKAKWTQLEALVGSKERTKQIAKDIVAHWKERNVIEGGKGMIVTMSRRIAADLYEEIINIKPEWHSDELKEGVLKVVMTASSSDGPKMSKHHTTKDQRRTLADRMKDPEDELKLVIVCDMWLTGFDAPSLHTLYIDKPMKGHNLMQAIARVNRVYKDKPAGLIVDYLGIASDLKKALSFYSEAGGKGDPAEAQEKAVTEMLERIEIISHMFHGFPYEDYFDASTSEKLNLILAAEDHILGLEDGKKRYINQVNHLSQSFSIALPHEQAMDVKEEVAFFQAVKARLVKFDSSGAGKTNEEIESVIRQVIDEALVSEQVIDVFDAAGIKKPEISILSEDFLLEVKSMEHKNIAMEVLKKLLNDEIKSRSRINLVQGKTLMEMLENSIKRYQNKVLTAAEFIDELVKHCRTVVEMDKEPQEMGLSTFEYAFYTAIANNDSAREVMEKDKLRELAVVLYEKVKNNASIDWTLKESARAKLRVVVKRTLRQYGYPPDMQKLATETVLSQAKKIAQELVEA
ncbi:type I restriction endonuclease subunit R [Rhodohalobacter sulfatireducens]|uniref:Type I restriction enzyme endonuclease subunit n=1 Tax=Rhodohalobacter sulfatireducens TaxID=2911366 RepID=A0ABS9KF78_9BACT|nr:type I restriction endonuclease subunit R [Rhodohalobacter sulfatireducens]MCG2589518.1 type I restriction endonuclease subunit R [Rhodohalobacter sulfatireducens]